MVVIYNYSTLLTFAAKRCFLRYVAVLRLFCGLDDLPSENRLAYAAAAWPRLLEAAAACIMIIGGIVDLQGS